jgi:hypothetical protein
MNRPPNHCVVLAAVLLLRSSQLQENTATDPLKQETPPFQLAGQTIIDGAAELNQTSDLAFAVELPLGKTISAPAPAVPKIVATVGPGTLGDALNRLCSLDTTFSWKRIGNTIHVFPRALINEPTYLLNRKIEVLNFKDATDAQGALFAAVKQLPGPREQIAIMQSGISLSFSRPWTASFKDITVREVLDKIAEQLGRNYGWQFGGATDFRIVTFHHRLLPKPAKAEPATGSTH